MPPGAKASRELDAVVSAPGLSRSALRAPRTGIASERVLRGWQRVIYWYLALAWTAANCVFWQWWLQSSHVLTAWMFAIFTVAFGYDIVLLPSVYLFFVGRMRRPKPIAAAPGARVALITLCVPASESLEIIEKELEALAAVGYPHDSWVLDEGNDPAVRSMADRWGVRYFSRAGLPFYNQPRPPFQAKTKAGNVNAWLDRYGGDYDFFVQFDVDHRPNPEYLDHVLGYFQDPYVAWVQPPSVYGNLDNWVARGAAEQELILQGPLQMGFYGLTDMPFIIGSHTAYRMSAIQEIGGFRPPGQRTTWTRWSSPVMATAAYSCLKSSPSAAGRRRSRRISCSISPGRPR